MKINSKKGKITILCVLIAAVMLSIFSAVIATDNTSTQYWKAVPMDVDSYRSDLNNLIAPDYDGTGDYIFAGWFTDKDCTEPLAQSKQTGSAYAKFVPTKILGIKAQVNVEIGTTDNDTTNDETGAIRFVTSVDSLDYREIGFVFERGYGEEIKSSGSVYTRLFATVGETDGTGTKDLTYIPSEEFDASSQYFKSWTYTSVPASAYNTEITVTPFWITLDGTTVKAETGMKTVNQGRQWKYIFVDDTGDDVKGTGTRGCPYQTLNGALNHIQKYGESEGGQIWIKDTLKTTADFEWKQHGVDVTIMGDAEDKEETENDSKLDFSALTDLYMSDAATFSNLTMVMPESKIYANGYRLEIAQDVNADTANTPNVYGGSGKATVESTDVTLLTGAYGNIYAGGNSQQVSGDTNLYIGGDVELSSKTVYGGCYNSTVSGDTHVTIGGNAQLQYVRGGGNSTNQKVEGTCYVSIQDNAIIEGVNGGGANGSTNNTYVVVKGGTIEQVLGGQTTSGGKVNNTNVHILGGTITRRVYGGSYNDYSSLKWQSTNSVAGYSSVTISPGATISSRTDDNLLKDTSICAVSRAEENYLTEVGVMILNYGTNSDEVGFSSAMKAISNANYTHFLVNVEEGGTVTSESGMLRIKPDPDNSSYYATVKDSSGNVLFQCQGEGTYSLGGLTVSSSVQTLTVSFSESIDETLIGNYVLSYGDNSYSYFNTLSDALASVSTPSVTDTTATITIYEENVTVDSILALTDGDKVFLTNAEGKNVTLTRTSGNTMFNIAYGCFLTIDGTIVVDGNRDNSIVGPTLVMNDGTFMLGEGATLQNAATEASSNTSEYSGAALYNTGNAYISGSMKNNYAYAGGAIYVASGIVELTDKGDAVFSGNSSNRVGGAIYIANSAALNAEGYTFQNNTSGTNGGVLGLASGSSVNLTDCIFDNNNSASESSGGVMYGTGTVNVDNCSFSNNNAKTGGAICIYEASAKAVVSIMNSTFDSNVATTRGGAIDVNGGKNVILDTCTFTKNDGGSSDSTIHLHTNGKQVDIYDVSFEGNVGGNTDVIYMNNAANVLGISGKIADAEIKINNSSALVKVNGKVDNDSNITITPTYEYAEGTQVVAKSDDTVSDLEFKNAIKVLDLTQVSGNYWFIDSTGCLSQVSATINGTEGSYADALAAITAGGTVEIEFLRNVEIADTITIPTGAEVTITNAVGKDVTITRTCTTSLFTVASGSTLTVGSEDAANKLVIDGGSNYDAETSTENGITASEAMILNAGTFNLKVNATLQNANSGNTSGVSLGGALYTTGTATIDGTIKNNRAFQGGAIYIDASDLAIITGEAANISGNSAKNGGAIFIAAGTFDADGTTFTSNSATENGGVIVSGYNSAYLDLNGCTFNNNTSGSSGGAIYARFEIIADGCTFESNEAGTSGGAICVYDGSNNNAKTEVKDSTFISNISATRASAIDINGGESTTVTVSGCTFSGNDDASTYSSTIQVQVASSTVLSDCTFNGNAEAVTDRIYMYNGSSTLAFSGKISDATVVKVEEEQLILNGTISEESNIIITPKTYSEGAQILIAGDSASAEELAKATNIIGVTPNDEGEWYISHEGILLPATVKAQVGTTYYTDVDEAIGAAIETLTDADSTATVYVLNDTSMDTGVEITTGTLVVTNALGKDVELTRKVASNLFSVEKDAALQIGADTSGTLVVDGGYDSEDTENSVVAPAVVTNAGTFTLGKNAAIQNAYTAVTKSDALYNGAALLNTGLAYVYGDFENTYGYNGGAVWNYGGTMHVYEGNYISNTSVAAGGAIYNSGTATLYIYDGYFYQNVAETGTSGAIYGGGTVTITGGTFNNNEAYTGGGVLNVAGTATVSGVTMTGNTVTMTTGSQTFYGGGAVYVSGSKTLTLSNSTIYNNTSNYDTKVPSCDIRFGNATAFSNSSISGININSTDYCYIYYSSTKYYIDSDGNTLIEVE